MIFLGIDIGTTSICGVAVDTERGRTVAVVSRANDAGVTGANRGERMQDPARIFQSASFVLASLARRFPRAGGLGVTGQMHGILYVNRKGDAVSPLFTWQDERAGQPFGKTTYAEALSDISGYRVTPGYGLATHFVQAQRKKVPRTAVRLCTIADYMVLKWGGGPEPVLDDTNAASLGLYDLRARRTDARAMERAGLNPDLLPRLVSSAAPVGLWRGIPLCAAIGDNQASFLGAVPDRSRNALINIGTGAQVSVYVRSLPRVDGLETRPFPGGGYLLVGASICGGKAFALLERFFRDTFSFFGRRAPRDLYARMSRVGASEIQPGGLAVDTRFFGTRTEPARRGAIVRIAPEEFTPGTLTAGFCDGMAEELFALYAQIPATVRKRVRTLIGSGNGLRKNALLKTMLETRFGRPVICRSFGEEAAVGAALSAAVGVHHASFDTAGRILCHED